MFKTESLRGAIARMGVYKTSDGGIFLGEKKAREHDAARAFASWYNSNENNQLYDITSADAGKWLDKNKAAIYNYFAIKTGVEKGEKS